MDRVPSIKKRREGRRRTVGLIIIMILIVGCLIGLAVKRKPVQTAGDKMGRQAVLSVFSVELEKQYLEFEKLFREQQDDIKELAKELLSINALENKEYLILFDEESYLDRQMGNPLGNHIEFLYSDGTFRTKGNEELTEILNKNINLKEALNSIIEKGVVIRISLHISGNKLRVYFLVDTKFTPFITGNNGVTNAFVYCEDEEYEKYGNKKIEDNWYLWISPAPE